MENPFLFRNNDKKNESELFFKRLESMNVSEAIERGAREAAEEGVGEHTVRRNAKFAEGIDVIREHNPDLATAILTDYVMKKSINSVRYLFI